MGFVYFIATDDFAHVKIGYSTDLPARQAALQTGNHRQLRLLAYMTGTENDERNFHDKWACFNTSGEWFSLTTSIINFLYENRNLFAMEESVRRHLKKFLKGGLADYRLNLMKRAPSANIISTINFAQNNYYPI